MAKVEWVSLPHGGYGITQIAVSMETATPHLVVVGGISCNPEPGCPAPLDDPCYEIEIVPCPECTPCEYECQETIGFNQEIGYRWVKLNDCFSIAKVGNVVCPQNECCEDDLPECNATLAGQLHYVACAKTCDEFSSDSSASSDSSSGSSESSLSSGDSSSDRSESSVSISDQSSQSSVSQSDSSNSGGDDGCPGACTFEWDGSQWNKTVGCSNCEDGCDCRPPPGSGTFIGELTQHACRKCTDFTDRLCTYRCTDDGTGLKTWTLASSDCFECCDNCNCPLQSCDTLDEERSFVCGDPNGCDVLL